LRPRKRTRAFFLGYGSPQPGKSEAQLKHEKDALAGLVTGSFRASSNKQLIPLRQIGLFRDKLKIENDEKLTAEEKSTKVREIEAKLAQIQRESGS
jgi:phosphonate transport system substrate-binding protein